MMQFWRWLEGRGGRERPWKSIVRVLLWLLVGQLIWCFLVLLNIYARGYGFIRPPALNQWIFWRYIVWGPFWEEMFFRVFPFWFLIIFARNRNLRNIQPGYLMATVAGWIGLFAFYHWYPHSVYNALVQLPLGLSYWLAFLYASRAGKNLVRGSVASFASHAAFNLIVQLIRI